MTEWFKVTKNTLIVYGMLNLVLLMGFLWHNELYMVSKQLAGIGVDGTMTNGFFTSSPMKIYHIWMYLLIFSNSMLVFLMIRDKDDVMKLETKK